VLLASFPSSQINIYIVLKSSLLFVRGTKTAFTYAKLHSDVLLLVRTRIQTPEVLAFLSFFS
jgi:hypothetical protein